MGLMVIMQVLASKTKINMVMELVTGGELFDKIVRLHYLLPQEKLTHECKFKLKSHFDISQVSNGKLTETEGRKMFQQLIDGISYCHIKGVFHRDLKVRVSHVFQNPNNLL